MARLISICLCALVVVCLSYDVQAEILGTEAAYNFSFLHNGNYVTLGAKSWVPEGVGTVRGMLFLCPGRGGDSRYWMDDDVKLAARSMGFGLVSWADTTGWVEGGDYQGATLAQCNANLQRLLDTTASLCNQPEVSNCPIAYYGFSKGGWVANTFSAQVPSRSIAFVSDKSSTWVLPSRLSAQKVPGMFTIGSVDPVVTPSWAWGGFSQWRMSQGSVALTVNWGQGHGGVRDDFYFSYLAEAAKERCGDQIPSTVPGNPVVLHEVDPDHVYYATASQLNGTVMTQVTNLNPVPADEHVASETEYESWLPNRTCALVNNAHKCMVNGNPLFVSIEGASLGDYISASEIGETVTVNVSLNLTPENVENIVVYLDDTEIDVTQELLDNGMVSLTYTPDESGVHTLIAAMQCDEGGTPNLYTNYDVLYVQPIPEPASMLLMALGGTLLLRRKKK